MASAFADDARTLIVRLDELVEQHNEINAVIAAVGIVVITTNQDGFDDLGAMSLWTFLRKNIAFWTAPPLLLSMMRTLPFDLARQMMQIVVQSPEPAHATISHDQDMWHLLPWGAKARDAQRFALDDGAMLYIRHQLLVGQQG